MPETLDTDHFFEAGDRYSAEGAKALQQGKIDEGHALFAGAIAEYEAAMADAPDDDVLLASNLRLCIGARRHGMGHLDEAQAEYEVVLSALEAQTDIEADGEAAELHAQARLNRAECWLATGRRAEARKDIEDVLADSPEHPYARMLLARC